MMLLMTHLSALGAATPTPSAACSQYTDCSTCLNPPDPALNCGWCSPSPAIFADGKTATQCMDHTSTGWDCFHLYMHDGCIQGYTCNKTVGQCQLAPPGQGDTKENCEKVCSPEPLPQQYKCNATSFRCELSPGGEEKSTCDGSCSNSTPAELIGLWRGLNVQYNFSIGEWVMNFSTTSVTWGPQGSPKRFEAHVATTAPQEAKLTFIAPAAMAGTIRYATYSTPGWPTGPETHALSIAIQRPTTHQSPPANVAEAMGKPDFDVFVMHGCNSWKKECNFAPAFATLPSPPVAAPVDSGMASFLRMLKAAGSVGSGVDDACFVHSDCGSCISDPLKVCGWCDGIITFGDGTTCGEDGNGCCGGASTFSRCNVVYRKECPVVCDWTNWTEPFCRSATTKEHVDKKVQKFEDCDQVEKWKACEYVPPKPPPPPMYSYCEPDTSGVGGSCKSLNKTECDNNPHCDTKGSCNPNVCKVPSFYTCDPVSLTCKEGPTGHYNTSKECDEACYNHDVSGVWRGLRIDNGFVKDEWDFNFSKATAGSKVVYKSKALGKTFTGTYAIGTGMTVDTFASFHLTITLSTGELLSGLYSDKDEGPITRFMYLGLPLTNGDEAMDYEDAMATSKQELVLIACRPEVAGCDFRPAML